VATRKRIEIHIETDRILIVRRHRAMRTWCRECGGEVDMIGLKAVQTLTGIALTVLREQIDNQVWHSFRSDDGQPLVCLESLLGWCALGKRNGGLRDER